MKKDNKPIIVFCAHNDDNIIGVGGTIAQYIKEGREVISVIFSYGEATHPWLKEREAIKMRVNESQQADRILGASRTSYLGLKEGKFIEEINSKDIKAKIKRIINIVRPEKIFTHSPDDPHPDHRAVYSAITQIMDELKYKCDVYSFDIWNPFNIRHRNKPKLFIDITATFPLKVKAFKLHKSQWLAMLTMLPAMYIRAILNGLSKGVKYAEVFVKLR